MPPRLLPLEGNPAVMNSYLRALGLPDPKVEFCDVLGLDPDLLGMLPRPIHAFMLLFPIHAALDRADVEKCREQKSELKEFMTKQNVFYMKQVVENACGTMAILHAVMNNLDVAGNILKDSPLDMLRSQGPEKILGEGAEQNETFLSIFQAHMEAAQEGSTQNQPIDADIDLHFTSFVHLSDRCVELDGRKPAPLLHGVCTDNEAFVRCASEAIKEKMSFQPESLRFNIIALTDACS